MVFVPVGLAYDRVLEDRVLVEAAAAGTRRFRNRPVRVAWHAARFSVARLRGPDQGLWHGGGGVRRAGQLAGAFWRTAGRSKRWARG